MNYAPIVRENNFRIIGGFQQGLWSRSRFSKLLESESGVGVGILKNLPTPQPWFPGTANGNGHWISILQVKETLQRISSIQNVMQLP